MKKKKPKFTRQRSHMKKRLRGKWRSPRGQDSKQKSEHKAKGAKPRIGYGSPKATRGQHPKGVEVLVHNMQQLEQVSEDKLVRISSRIGKKKKQEMIKKAGEKGLTVLNK
jgi:large subunit ribosomal protein L32e